jgi:hypothetical protein
MNATIAGHATDCLCTRCMMADMDAAIAANGQNPDTFPVEHVDSERTRYAKPGQSCGTGVVRVLSPAQVRYIKRLLVERDTTGLVRLPGSENVEKMSLRGARDLIDRLLACPMREGLTERMATDSQLTNLRREVLRREVTPPDMADMLVELAASDTVTFKAAHAALDILFASPFKPRPAAKVELESGIYLLDGVVYKVQKAIHGSGRMYAKRLDPTTRTFGYAPNAISTLAAEHRMTLEQAKEFGAVYGVCCNCARTLTDEKSIEAGIGPVCAKKFA